MLLTHGGKCLLHQTSPLETYATSGAHAPFVYGNNTLAFRKNHWEIWDVDVSKLKGD